MNPIQITEAGIREMSHHSAIICGIIRDNNKHFRTMKTMLEDLASHFRRARFLIVENDSADGTAETLDSWAAENPAVLIIHKTYGNKKRPSIDFLAQIRNIYLDYIETAELSTEYDILAVADLDWIIPYHLHGIYSSFADIGSWDVVCSNGVVDATSKLHYDLFALDASFFPNNKIAEEEEEEEEGGRVLSHHSKKRKHKTSEFRNYISSLWNRRLVIKPNPLKRELLAVRSCFGGLQFIKTKFLSGCRYSSNSEYRCEHRDFNECLQKNGARIVINPNQETIWSGA